MLEGSRGWSPTFLGVDEVWSVPGVKCEVMLWGVWGDEGVSGGGGVEL